MVTINIGDGRKFDLSNAREMRYISHDDAEKVVGYIRTTISHTDESMYLRPISESTTFLSKLSLEKLKSVFSMARKIANSGKHDVLEHLCAQGAVLMRLDNDFLRDIESDYPDINTEKLRKIVSLRIKGFETYYEDNKEKTPEYIRINPGLEAVESSRNGANTWGLLGTTTLLGAASMTGVTAVGATIFGAYYLAKGAAHLVSPIVNNNGVYKNEINHALIRTQCLNMAKDDINALANLSDSNEDTGEMLDRVIFRSQFCQFLEDYPLDRLTNDNELGNIPFRTDEIVDLAIKLADRASNELFYKDDDPLKNICKNRTMHKLPNLDKLFKFCKNRDEINLLADNLSLGDCKSSEISILRDVPNKASNMSKRKINDAYERAIRREQKEANHYVTKEEFAELEEKTAQLEVTVSDIKKTVDDLGTKVLENARNIGLNTDNFTKLGALIEAMSNDVEKLSDNQENHSKELKDLQESFKELNEIISDPDKKEALETLLSSETIDREFNDDLMVIQDEIASKIDSSQYPKAAEQIQEFAVGYKAALSKLYDIAPLTLGDTMSFIAGKKAKRVKLTAQMVGGASAIAAEAGGAKGALAGAGGLLIGSKLSQMANDEAKKVVSSMTALGKIVDGSDDDPTRRTPTQQRNIAMKVINLHVMQMAEHFASDPRKIQRLSAGLVDAKKSGANYHKKVIEAFNGIADNINLINQGTASATSETSRILHNSRNRHPQIAEIAVSSPLEEAATRMTAAALTSNIPGFLSALRPHASHSKQEASERALAYNTLYKKNKGTLRGTIPATVTDQPPTSPERRRVKVDVAHRTIARHSQSTTGVFNSTRIG